MRCTICSSANGGSESKTEWTLHTVHRKKEHEKEWRHEEWKSEDRLSKQTQYRETILWHVIRIAEENDNDGYLTIRPDTKLTDIPRNMGHFNALSRDWQQVPLQEDEFDDDWYVYMFDDTHRRAEMLLFTDEPMGRIWGYWYHAINGSDYNQINQETSDLAGYLEQVECKTWEHHAPLSKRCSIDYCEAYAIQAALAEALVRLDKETRDMSGIATIRVISDSETVLRWISREYTTRQQQMKDTVHDIRRMRAMILQKGGETCLQWTHSPSEMTKENDAADANAHMGHEAADESKQQYDATINERAQPM